MKIFIIKIENKNKNENIGILIIQKFSYFSNIIIVDMRKCKVEYSSKSQKCSNFKWNKHCIRTLISLNLSSDLLKNEILNVLSFKGVVIQNWTIKQIINKTIKQVNNNYNNNNLGINSKIMKLV